jgi:hypothetical protein
VLALINLIDSKYVTTDKEYRPIDFGQKAQFFTLDVISAVAYGFPFGFLATDTDVYHYIEMSEKVVPAGMVVTVYPWINHILTSSFMKSLLPSATDPIGFGKILGFVLLFIHLGMVKRTLNTSMHSNVTMAMVDVARGRFEHL